MDHDQPEFFDFSEDEDGLNKYRGLHRIPDHSTAIEAAQTIEQKRSMLQREVIRAFEELGAMTDEQLEDLPRFSRYTYSTVRKRRTELYQQGIVIKVGETINSHGARMNVWDLK